MMEHLHDALGRGLVHAHEGSAVEGPPRAGLIQPRRARLRHRVLQPLGLLVAIVEQDIVQAPPPKALSDVQNPGFF